MISVEEYHNQFLDYLQKYTPPNSPSNLYEPVSYILSLKGKRIRPILTLLTCDLFNDNFKDAFDAALAVEVFHNFSLVHDDIMDEAPLRRGNETVHKKWDLSTAILSGDVMLILAYQLFENYSGDTFVSLAKLFSKTAIEVCEGQQMDIDFSNTNDVSPKKYLKMIEFKTAVLLGASMKMGAIVSNASINEQNSIYEFGRNLGMAFQIQDDFLDTFGDEEKFGKMIGGDIIENKKTLLFIRATQLLDKEDRLKLIKLYSTKSLDNHVKIKEVKDLYEKCGIPLIMRKEIEQFTHTAFQMLENINFSNEKKQFLIDFGNSLMKRNI
jgi:geranylgeranyl diphosphate synthase type II